MDQPGALQGQEYIETFEQLCTVTLQKPCFDGPYGRAWQGVMGRAYDTQMDRLYYAKECQWPDYTPTDALQYLAAERGLERTVIVGIAVVSAKPGRSGCCLARSKATSTRCTGVV